MSNGYGRGGGYAPMGVPGEEDDDDVLFIVDKAMVNMTLSGGKMSEGVVGVDKDGDGTTDDIVLFTWEG